MPERVSTEQAPGRQEGQTHGRGLEANREGVVGVLRALDGARFENAPRVWRKAPRFQANHIGNINAGQGLASAGQVAGTKDLKIVRRRVAGETQVLPALAKDFMHDSGRQAV